MARMVIVGVRVPQHIVDDIDLLAEREGITRSDLVRRWFYERLDAEKPKLLRERRKLFGGSPEWEEHAKAKNREERARRLMFSPGED